MKILPDQTKKNIMQSYFKYKAHFDRKAEGAPLETTDYCYILNPKADTQATKIPFREFKWCGPYKVEKVLPNNNYIVWKLGTKKKQLLHRIGLRKFTQQAPLAVIFVRETDWQIDDQMLIANKDLYAQPWNTRFGSNPFDVGPSEYSPDTEDAEYTPIHIPDDNRPPSPGFSKNCGEAQWNRPLNQIRIMKIMQKKNRNKPAKMIKVPNKLKNQITHQKMISKKPQKTLKIPHCKKNP